MVRKNSDTIQTGITMEQEVVVVGEVSWDTWRHLLYWKNKMRLQCIYVYLLWHCLYLQILCIKHSSFRACYKINFTRI